MGEREQMIVITAINDYELKPNDVCVFLAGGITNCYEWQNMVIERLKEFNDTDRLVMFNPRRDDFPIGNPNASLEQIKWEYKWLERMDIFSMYFAKSESDQPICMYELGRNLLRMQMRYPPSWRKRIIISVEQGYRREQDVDIQTALATNNLCHINKSCDTNTLIYAHSSSIYDAYQNVLLRA